MKFDWKNAEIVLLSEKEPITDLVHEERAAFEVHQRNGNVWKVYANGKIEGFPDECFIINRIPLMVYGQNLALSSPTNKPAEDGLAHG